MTILCRQMKSRLFYFSTTLKKDTHDIMMTFVNSNIERRPSTFADGFDVDSTFEKTYERFCISFVRGLMKCIISLQNRLIVENFGCMTSIPSVKYA